MVNTSNLPPSVRNAIQQQKVKDTTTGRATSVSTSTDSYGNVRVSGGSSSMGSPVPAQLSVAATPQEKVSQENTLAQIQAERFKIQNQLFGKMVSPLPGTKVGDMSPLPSTVMTRGMPQMQSQIRPEQLNMIQRGEFPIVNRPPLPSYATSVTTVPEYVRPGPTPMVTEAKPFTMEGRAKAEAQRIISDIRDVTYRNNFGTALGKADALSGNLYNFFPSKEVAQARREAAIANIPALINQVGAAATLAAFVAFPELGPLAATAQLGYFALNPSPESAVDTGAFLLPGALAKTYGLTKLAYFKSVEPFAENIVKMQPQVIIRPNVIKEAPLWRIFDEPSRVSNANPFGLTNPDIPIRGTPLVMSRYVPFNLGFPITESGVMLKAGQTVFPSYLSSPKQVIRYTESGQIPTRPVKTELEGFFSPTLEVVVTKPISVRMNPFEYAMYLERRGKLNIGIGIPGEGAFLSPITVRNNIVTSTPFIGLRENPTPSGQRVDLAHELIHYKTPILSRFTLPGYRIVQSNRYNFLSPMMKKIIYYGSYRGSLNELVAFGLQNRMAKKGFKVTLGPFVYTKPTVELKFRTPSEKVSPMEIKPIDKRVSQQTALFDFGLQRPISRQVSRKMKPFLRTEDVSKSTNTKEIEILQPSSKQESILLMKKPEGTMAKVASTPNTGLSTMSPSYGQKEFTFFEDIPAFPFTTLKEEQRRRELPIIVTRTFMGTSPLQVNRPNSIISNPTDIGSIPKTNVNADIFQNTEPIIGSGQSQDIAQAQSQFIDVIPIQNTAVGQQQKQRIEQKQEPKTPEEEPPITQPDNKKSKKKPFNFLKALRKGYKVRVRKGGKWYTVSPSVTKEAALDIGAAKVKGGLEASFEIYPTSEEPNLDIKQTGTFERFASTFRNYEIRKGNKFLTPNRFIEKRSSRLLTSQERGAIKIAKKQSNFMRGGKSTWF